MRMKQKVKGQGRLLLALIFAGLLPVSLADPSDPCMLKYDPGPCRAHANVVAFDSALGKCVVRSFGGCRGNANRFSSMSECESTCAAHLKVKFEVPDPICNLPPMESLMSCMGLFPKFTFNAEVGRCEQYIYGGCHGTDNLFVTEDDCVSKCMLPSTEAEDIPQPRSNSAITFPTDKTPEVCGQPIEIGPCNGYIESYGFNIGTGRCEKFHYGGCKGNGNRFESLGACVNTCGGNRPEPSLNCVDITCDDREAELNRAKGCRPITRPGDCCPSSWECPLWEQYLNQTSSHCFFASKADPYGRLYAVGENIQAGQQDSCHQACFCSGFDGGPAKIVCAMVDCFHPPQFSFDRCVAEYKTVHSCCASGHHCDNARENLPTCQLEGVTYRKGEQMFPKSDPCMACLCKEDWDGTVTSSHCERIDCGLGYSNKLARGCSPIYREDRCCPTEWLCPEDIQQDQDLLIDEADKSEETTGNFVSVTSTALRPADACYLPKETGPCEAHIPSFYFDIASRRCVPFVYGGCKGNKNNFATEEECESACSVHIGDDPPSIAVSAVKLYRGKEARCNEPAKMGVCRSRMKKYFYNPNIGDCQQFFYSGCRGNGNKFDTLAECVRTCIPPSAMLKRPQLAGSLASAAGAPSLDECVLPLAVGNCRSYKPRWHFNQDTQSCQRFVYSGCNGNANNFMSEAACRSACQPQDGSLPNPPFINVGPAQTLPELIPGSPISVGSAPGGGMSCPGCPSSSSINGEIKKVAALASRKLVGISAVDEDCQHTQLLKVLNARTQVVAGTNYFLDLKMTTKTGDDCSQVVTKICSNIVVHKPLPFACSENDLCLSIIREDEIRCEVEGDEAGGVARQLLPEAPVDPLDDVPPPPPPPVDSIDDPVDPCALEKVIGRCKASIPRFYFNKMTGRCQQFIYGGCGGNANNFLTKSECLSRCTSASPRINIQVTPFDPTTRCGEPMVTGRCRAYSVRYYYNQDSRNCEEFQYGGCGGNGNNFPSFNECQATCVSSPARPADTLQVNPVERCEFNNQSLAIGDIVRFNSDPCQFCVCSAPPSVSCLIKKCPLTAPIPSRRDSCKEVRDENGCCVTGYQCDDDDDSLEDDHGMVGSIPGGIGMAGGFTSRRPPTPEARKVAARAYKKLANVHTVTGPACAHYPLRLVNVLSARTQVVAGLNFDLQLQLKVPHGSLCDNLVDRYCSGVKVHRPLGCSPSSYATCLQLIVEDQIQCFDNFDDMLTAN